VAKAYPSSAGSLIPLSKEEIEKIVQLSSQMEEAQILSSLRLLIEQEWALRHSANPQIILETVVLELCRLKQLTSVGDLLRQIEGGAAPSVPSPIKTGVSIPKAAPPASVPSYAPPAAPQPAAAQEGEPALAVDEIEDSVPDDKNPEMTKLKSHWRELLEKVKAQKTSLEGVLADTRPKNIDEGTLILVCKGPFHHEQLSKPENKVLVEKLLEELLGRKITLVPVLPEGAPAPSEKPSGPRAPKPLSAPKVDLKELEKEEPLVAAALKMFGGKIVEVKRNNPQK
jgi:DNA polymerase III subunit gamma/tau